MKTSNIYNFEVNEITGNPVHLEQFAGKVLLIVNVASECGLTKQYTALEQVFEKYAPQGFSILGFPANEFGAQEPGSNSEIQEFCTSHFGVKFPMFSKIAVKGSEIHPLYSFLTSEQPKAILNEAPSFEKMLEEYGHKRINNSDILWNFEKFLINKKGQVVARFNPDITPDDPIITKAIEAELNK